MIFSTGVRNRTLFRADVEVVLQQSNARMGRDAAMGVVAGSCEGRVTWRADPMKFRKPVAIAILAGITAVNALVLLLTQTSFFPTLGRYLGSNMTMTFIVLGLIVVLAIAMTALGYGIGVEGRVRRAGKSRRHYRRSREGADSRRTQEFQTSFGAHDH